MPLLLRSRRGFKACDVPCAGIFESTDERLRASDPRARFAGADGRREVEHRTLVASARKQVQGHHYLRKALRVTARSGSTLRFIKGDHHGFIRLHTINDTSPACAQILASLVRRAMDNPLKENAEAAHHQRDDYGCRHEPQPSPWRDRFLLPCLPCGTSAGPGTPALHELIAFVRHVLHPSRRGRSRSSPLARLCFLHAPPAILRCSPMFIL